MDGKKGKPHPPKLHKFMHPKNPYRTPPSFKDLAQKYPEFREHCIYDISGKVRLNFKDPKAVRSLTTCLLDQDFGLKVTIPDDRLVPTLPLRFNYLLWIEDLLTLSANRYKKKNIVVGVDVGCGASCIYPLLAAKQKEWCMVATESDDINFSTATDNAKKNNLQSQIVVRKVGQEVTFKSVLDDEEIINAVHRFQEKSSADSKPEDAEKKEDSADNSCITSDGYLYDFTMCNPPFFSSVDETDSMKKSKKDRGEPTSAPTGAVQETVTEGGEVAFVTRMIDESFLLKDKIRIFTTMIGSKSHVKPIKDKLKAVNPAHSAVVEFCQGRTMRWGIAWTFDTSLHLQNVMSKKQMSDAKPLILMIPRSRMSVYTVQAAWAMINKWLHQLKINVQEFKNTKYFVGVNIKAYKPTWLHQRRKKREQAKKETNSSDKDNEDGVDKTEEIGYTDDECTSSKRTVEAAELLSDQERKSEEETKRQKLLDTDNETTNRECCPEQPSNGKNASSEKQNESSDSIVMEDDDDAELKETEEGFQESSTTGGGLECILKAKLQVKQIGALVSLEALFLRGSYGKDGLNQIFQYMRNRLSGLHS